jgi:proteasome lid subunit RPN8/RPN11
VVVVREGQAERVVALENLAASPFRFEVGADLVSVYQEADASGADIGCIYHSHTRSEPYPSQTDINFAANWPGVEWLIVGLAGDGEPIVRSYLIDGGQVSEVPVEVTG